MKYRSRAAIIANMLRCITDGCTTKTKIMYCAYLSYSQVSEYLALLQKRGFVTSPEKDRGFTLTPKGEQLLRSLVELGLLINPHQKDKDEQSTIPDLVF